MYLREVLVAVLLAASLIGARAAGAFGEIQGACESDCSKCHQVTIDEARELVKGVNPEIEVVSIREAPVRGLWELAIQARGVKSLAYLDFAKKHVLSGAVIDVSTKRNITNSRLYEISRVDVARLTTEEAIAIGDPEAPNRVFVFSDPD